MSIRIIKHDAVPQTGSFEVRFSDGRPSVYFYWDDVASRSSEQMDSERALEAAKTFREASGKSLNSSVVRSYVSPSQ